jgi:hypothetical protein
MFNLAIDSKLRGCDVVSLKVEDVATGIAILERQTPYAGPGGAYSDCKSWQSCIFICQPKGDRTPRRWQWSFMRSTIRIPDR